MEKMSKVDFILGKSSVKVGTFSKNVDISSELLAADSSSSSPNVVVCLSVCL